MNKRNLRAFVAMGALATACASWGCVADRPSRNGVFNENQYIRKDFLIRSGTGGADPGWFMKSTLVSASTPDPFANYLFNGQVASSGGGGTGFFLPYVRWVITSDKLQLVNMKELSASNSTTNTTGAPADQATLDPEVVNAWPITNVDLKYEINLDGEITNFFQENQEADWQERQWVKVNFDKNDMSDIAPMGEFAVAYLEECGDATGTSTTLVPGSFLVDETNNYMTWQVQVTVPVNVTDATCLSSYGSPNTNGAGGYNAGTLFQQIGRQDETMTLMYSFVRASASSANDSGIWDPTPVSQGGRGCGTGATGTGQFNSSDLSCPASTYVAMPIAEKDPIQRKYGAWEGISIDRDPTSGLLAAQALITRLNPNRTGGKAGDEPGYTLYLAPGYPQEYEMVFCGYGPPTAGQNNLAALPATGANCGAPGTGGLVDQMNKAWELAGARIRMRVLHADDDPTAPGETGFGKHAASNPKVFGDVRYSMIRFIADMDTDNPFLGVTQPMADPRTGEIIVNDIDFQNENFMDAYASKLEFYLSTIAGNGATQAGNPEEIVNNAFLNTPTTGCSMTTLGATIPLSTVAPAPTCINGVCTPSVDNSLGGAVQTNLNAISTVFQKMQTYLHKPLSTYGYLGPQDFVPQEDSDFYSTFFKMMPYEFYRDPASNPYVIAEGGTNNYAGNSAQTQMQALNNIGQFQSFMSNIDHGQAMFDGSGETTGPANVAAFTQQFQALNQGFTESRFQLNRNNFDSASEMLSYFDYLALDTRHCVATTWQNNQLVAAPPHWESLSDWLNNMVAGIWAATAFHEFGHSMGLRHNFAASLDRNNYPTYCTDAVQTQGTACSAAGTHVSMYANSIMEYTTRAGDLFWAGGPAFGQPANDVRWNGRPGFLPYDFGAFGWIYGNNLTADKAGPQGAACTAGAVGCGVSGQSSATAPWNDPVGFVGGAENPYLFCTDEHVQYSPFCQRFDFGTSPSEIIASELNQEEWFYKWTNFRLYHKFWDDGTYAAGRATLYHDLLRFLSSWYYDWNPGNLPELFAKLNIPIPSGVPQSDYYGELQAAFQNDISVANQLVAAFHLAMVQQASGERPYITTFDPFYGDVTQQGIIIDKIQAIQNFTTLYPVDNYDQNQAAGAYLFASVPLGNDYQSVEENAVTQFIGGQYDIFLYALPLAVSNFAQMTQDIYYPGAGGRASIRQWIGAVGLFGNGAAGIDPNQPFLDWAANLAAQWGFGCDATGQNCGIGQGLVCTTTNLQGCTWDPRQPQINSNDVYHSDPYNEFRGPDNRRYAWAPIKDRNQILLVDRDTNTATYVVVRNWNTDVTYQMDDGSGPAYFFELPMKYFLNAYNAYN
jgi:hypothetical protein